MMNFKLVKCGLGVSLALGLSACNWDMQRSQHVDSRYEPMNQAKPVHAKAKPVQKTYASKDPTQKATPGPARKAAPQLPVIQ